MLTVTGLKRSTPLGVLTPSLGREGGFGREGGPTLIEQPSDNEWKAAPWTCRGRGGGETKKTRLAERAITGHIDLLPSRRSGAPAAAWDGCRDPKSHPTHQVGTRSVALEEGQFAMC